MGAFNNACARGALIGLAVGAGVLAVAWSGVSGSGSSVLRFLVAVPPFLFAGLQSAPEPLQALVVVIWWVAAGAFIGWGVGRGPGGKILAMVISAVLIFGHLRSQAAIERNLGTVADAMERLLRTLFGTGP